YTTSDIDRIRKALEINAADGAVTTEKDAIRLPANDIGFPLNVLAIEIEVTETHGRTTGICPFGDM
ncbi:MAG: hypothetical protein J7M12_04675, partial [Candidatus Hydrogenedentes bacterium]|nr:hypothetical protein [Candidatus Hydrogenedentota bacterium]